MDFSWFSRKKLTSLTFQEIREVLLNLPEWILILWILINLIPALYGALLYFWQYVYYHPIFWIFIPDSSTFAIFFAIFLTVTLGFKKNIQVLNVITFIGLIRAFFAYILIITVRPAFLDIGSLTAHLVELGEALVLLPFIKVDLKNFQLASLITWIDWFFDFNPFPFSFPTLPLYPVDEINPDNTAPFIELFAVVFAVIIIILMTYIRLKHWITTELKVNWVEDLPNSYSTKKY
jgi:uncharacterized membrane protein YpjA